ncbi:hypothetical protein [Actinomycetospora aeridis]|uniref:ANTAR domain-containing protein n=1 Tax=Actinomycetospora aeridis TaxID=3129231 RepID=A0ABU8NBD6_9PSEU
MTDPGEPFGLRESLRLMQAHHNHPDHAGYDPLDALLSVCVDTIPAADAAAISHAQHNSVRSTHLTDPAISEIDRWQEVFAQGPLLDQALASQPYRSVLIVDELVLDAVIEGAIVEAVPPFRSLHSTTLRSERGHRTALDLYARNPNAFGADTSVLADMFAIRAAHLLYGHDDTRADLEHILTTTARRLGLSRATLQALLEEHLGRDSRSLDADQRNEGRQQPPDVPPM